MGGLPRCIQLLHLDQAMAPMYRSAAPWVGVFLAITPVAEHRGWKRIRSMEYLGYGRGYLLVRG